VAQDYGAALMDLNHDEPVPVDVYDWRLRPLRLHLARSVVESDFRISVGPPKTHDAVTVTLSLKNWKVVYNVKQSLSLCRPLTRMEV
jgi:uncharacterized protein (DUF362 family)